MLEALSRSAAAFPSHNQISQVVTHELVDGCAPLERQAARSFKHLVLDREGQISHVIPPQDQCDT